MAVSWETTSIEPQLLELARLRIAQLSTCAIELQVRYSTKGWAGIDESYVENLAQWPTHPLFTEKERAVIEYAEAVFVDPHGIPDSTIDLVRPLFDDGEFYHLSTALVQFAEFQRMLLLMGATDSSVEWSTSTVAKPLETAGR
jgi:alkylhydroperoxidase family enzyme